MCRSLFFASLFILLLSACDRPRANPGSSEGSKDSGFQVSRPETPILSFDDTLERYFDRYRIRPDFQLVNQSINRSVSRVSLPGHRFEWRDGESGTSYRIDGRRYELNAAVTRNRFADGGKDNGVDYVNRWDEIRLYRLGPDEEIMVVRMVFDPCTGIGCSAFYFLVYDLQTRTPNYFGSFRGGPGGDSMNLYRFPTGKGVHFLSRNSDHVENAPIPVTYQLFERNSRGQFLQQPSKIRQDTLGGFETMDWFEPIR